MNFTDKNYITASTIDKFTAQQVFNFVAYHLLKQGCKSFIGVSCSYRSADNKRCAVGFLLSDEEYDENLEGKALRYIKYFKDSQHLDLLYKLQEIHDFYDTEAWHRKLTDLAKELSFDIKECLTALKQTD